MPKIIKDLDKKIFDAAFELFSEKGYKDVDMKMIASKIGIAVGTLYNYYPNKKQIFINVFKRSWESTFSKLDGLASKNESYLNRVKQFIETLYNEIEERKGLGRELFQENIWEDENKLFIKNELISRLENLIIGLINEKGIEVDNYFQKRYIETIIVAVGHMRAEHEDEKEENIKYIIKLLDCLS